MLVSIIIILGGIWNLYNFASTLYDLPYISIATNNFLVGLNVIILKWSLILGILQVVFGILCLFQGRKEDDDKVKRMKIILLIIAIFTSICLLF